MAKRRNTDHRSMLDLPLRGEEKRAELPLDRPADSPAEPSSPAQRDEVPPARPLDRRRPRRKKRHWPILLILLLVLAAIFAIYRFTTPTAGFSVEVLEFGEQAVGGMSAPASVTVTNTGSRAMSLVGVRFAGEAAGEFELVSDECGGSTRQPGESCVVEIAFRPAANGRRAAWLDLEGNALGKLEVVGTGAAPVLTADRVEIDFGPQPVDGRGANRTLNLSNAGSTPMRVSALTAAGDHPADFAIDRKCTSTDLPPGDSCGVRIEFTPRAAGERTALLQVESDGSAQAATIALKGSGVWSGQPLDATPPALDFGEQRRGRKSGTRQIAFINRTSEPVAVEGVRLGAGSSAFAIEAQECGGTTLGPGDECGVGITFTPADEGKAVTAVVLRTAAGIETQVEIEGVGVEPRLALEKSSLDFGELRVNFQNQRRAVLSNSGTAKLAFGDATLAGSDRSSFAKGKDGCSGFTLEPGRTCTIEVVFEPRKTGRLTAELVVESDAAGGRRAVSLTGRGAMAELSLDRTQLDFGSVRRPGSANQALTLRNDGSSRLRILGMGVTGGAAADFVVSAIACDESGLAAGASCQATVRFVPRADGARAARLVIQHDGDGPAKEVSLIGTAMPALPGFGLSSRAIEFGTRQVGSRSSVETLTISNPGDGNLVLRSISIDGPQAVEFTLVPGTCDGAPYVAPRGSCTVGVRFNPRANGNRTATLRIRHNAGGDGSVGLNGQGTGG